MSSQNLQTLQKRILSQIIQARSLETLAQVEKQALARKSGEITELMKSIKNLSADKKREIAPQIQQLKKEIELALGNRKDELTKNSNSQEFFDPTTPGKNPGQGHIHPLTQALQEIEDFFTSLGFMVLDGPEVDSTFFNFEAVNVPDNHPARDMQDTFYVGRETVLRTHTSNCQVRAMREFGAPLRAIVPGRVFRNENRDARHEHTFLQFEGFMIDENISIANFRDIMDQFFRKFVSADTEVRIRPGYFPFVEPGFEVDFKCTCQGKGCGLCKGTGWVEFGGAGMIHPNVLRHGNINPKKYSGWAFGCSPERLICIRHEIPDLRLFRTENLRFLEQF